MVNEKLLSIVVPTRNRADYAASLIRSLHQSNSQDFEVVVRDNSVSPDLRSTVETLGDPRIRYDYSAAPLNMHQNFDDAVAMARGTYVCALGDDDGVLVDEALSILADARAEKIDAVLTQVLVYNWPGVRHWFWGDVGATLSGAILCSDGKRTIDPSCELERVFRTGATEGLGFLPRVYHGFVKRRSLEALRSKCGSCFPAESPDMANAVALVPFVNKILYSPKAAIISGHSPRSGGGAGAAGRHHGRLEDQTHLPAGTLVEWSAAIPRFWSGVTIYAQSAVVAARASSAEALPQLSYHVLYAACFVYESRRYWADVLHAARAAPGPRLTLALRVCGSILRLVVKRGTTFVANLFLQCFQLRGERYRDIGELIDARRSGAGAQLTPLDACQQGII